MAPESTPDPGDPFSSLNYRRLIAWPERIQREAPFLESVAAQGPERSLLDLGCGSGEHARFFADLGYRVVGMDASESQLRLARDAPLPPQLRFEAGDMTRLGESGLGTFGTVLTLGNALVHLLEEEVMAATGAGVFAALQPGGGWLVQILNYERLRARGERALPVSVRPGDDEEEETVFLRLLRPLPEGRIEFVPVTLRWRPQVDPPVEIVSSRTVVHRGWTRGELAPLLERAGFASVEWFGDMRGAPFDPAASTDLVFLARR
jgi:glycine/sarcosine N-methyltransferase